MTIIFLQFIEDTVIPRTHFFLLLYLNGAILIAKLETQEASQCLKRNTAKLYTTLCKQYFQYSNPYGIKLLTRLRVGLSHFRDHKFRYCFQDTLNPLCDCGNDTETTTHFFLHCLSFHTPRQTLLNNIRNINEQIPCHGEDQLIQTFLYGNPNFNLTFNRLILNTIIEYLVSTERLKCPLFNQ